MDMPSAPDIYVNSDVDAATLEISAFESLVGAHGGLGGWQDHGMLIAPTRLLDPARPQIHGAEELHQALVSMLVQLGQRTSLSRPAPQGPDSPGVADAGQLVPDPDEHHE